MNEESGSRKFLIGALFAILAIIVFGLVWFFLGSGSASPVGFGWYLFSFAAGLSMIVLPCTLPLAFVIVPLSMGKGPIRGFMIAIAFGLGVAVTLSMYGIIAAIIGKVAIGSLGAPLEVVKNWLYFIAGAFAYLFALGELGLVKFRMPSYSGAFPGFIQKQQDIFKALLLGLFLGNVGVGCPHPATPVILTRIAVSGDVFYGWLLFFVHATGRILPLIFLAILGILGVNALSSLVKHKEKIARATGWGMVFVAAFILVLGLFSHDWWVTSGQHTYLEELTGEEHYLNIIAKNLGAASVHQHGLPPADNTGLFGLPLPLGTWTLLFLWVLPFFWYYYKKKKNIAAMTESPEKQSEQKTLPYLFWNFVTISLILVLVFGYILPNRFLQNATMETDHHDPAPRSSPGIMMENHASGTMDMMSIDRTGHTTHYQEELSPDEYREKYGEEQEGVAVNFNATPESPTVGEEVKFDFYVNEKPKGTPIPESDLGVQHTKKMHVIGVRRDLNEFLHIHPVAPQETSAYLKTVYVFDKPGDYKIWSEINYQDVNLVYGHPILTVSGEGPTSELAKEITTNQIVGDKYQVAIDYHDGLSVGENNHIDFSIKTLTGNGVVLGDFLGAKMHLSVISEDLAQFIHTHPNDHGGMQMDDGHGHSSLVPVARANGGEESVPQDHVGFTVPFAKEGFYKMFAQFRPADATLSVDDALVAEFWINVSKAQEKKPEGISPWWRNLLVSIAAILILSWVVKKFITVPLDLKKQ
ncbi:MAG: cytochrome c biogenesis protein CcdA [Patescibacteria group bacterium]